MIFRGVCTASVPELVRVLESNMCSFACILFLILFFLNNFWKLATSCVGFSSVFYKTGIKDETLWG